MRLRRASCGNTPHEVIDVEPYNQMYPRREQFFHLIRAAVTIHVQQLRWLDICRRKAVYKTVSHFVECTPFLHCQDAGENLAILIADV